MCVSHVFSFLLNYSLCIERVTQLETNESKTPLDRFASISVIKFSKVFSMIRPPLHICQNVKKYWKMKYMDFAYTCLTSLRLIILF